MMIRINLLPVRKVQTQQKGRKVLILFALALLIAGGANYSWYADRAKEYETNANAIENTRTEIAKLEKVIGEVRNINARKTEVEKKLAVLDSLRKGRNGPVRMMDALASAVPKKVWVKAFSEVNSGVAIDGSAVSHDEVAEFMRGLNGVVWTPKGMGRLVDQRREAKTSRVELLTAEATIEEFPSVQITPFFTNIDLNSAVQTKPTAAGMPSLVDFKITLTANYAI
ncbi:PilN domain-containing protein [Myxococcus sp. K15C18031901]|uniref:PilN domain-containing protein n=1 Tax=Myxococcus dinghuensis TaxID=2906761 RepID=UPI0020A741B8|nr:PilN domain-containing protein [Myxococcus dinghuensis]MCP3105095.1 PilN domain-containing protein [Myxococcus dinghuensis]